MLFECTVLGAWPENGVGRRARGADEGCRPRKGSAPEAERRAPARLLAPGRFFIIVVHPPQKVKEISRLWRNSLFSSKGWDKTGAFMGLLPHGA